MARMCSFLIDQNSGVIRAVRIDTGDQPLRLNNSFADRTEKY